MPCLRRGPSLRILATSRERLGIAGELARRVPSLSLPRVEAGLAPARARPSEAVSLFVARLDDRFGLLTMGNRAALPDNRRRARRCRGRLGRPRSGRGVAGAAPWPCIGRGSTWKLARTLNCLANTARAGGEYPKAAALYEEALPLLRACGEQD